ncbi:CocE/NonD family hydrolase [Microbacterium sp. MM2322]|uniref:alpha/beta hydrolase n=1 Tax=Microbacterium sp. MM2322 TaxID=3157631 RepID=UPI0032D57EDB
MAKKPADIRVASAPPAPPRPFWRDRPKVVALLAVFLMIAGSYLAMQINTAGGSTNVREVTIFSATGQQISADLYTPANMAPDKPAPAVAMWHGLNNQKQHMQQTALELARRGFIVLSADQIGHGSSNGANQDAGCGGPATLAYLQTVPGVDASRIGLVGMSQGGFCAATSAALSQPEGYASVFYMESEPGQPGSVDASALTGIRNAAVLIGDWTELPGLIAVGRGLDAPVSPALQAFFGTSDRIEAGRTYGSIEDGTARILYTEWEGHASSTDSPAAIGDAVEWMQKTLTDGSGLSPDNQIWPLKLVGTSLALLGGILFLFAGGSLLLRTRAFAGLVRAVPEYRGLRGPGWWIGAVITTALGPLLYLAVWKNMFFTPVIGVSTLWPQNFTNIYMVWGLVVGVIAWALIALNHFAFTRRAGGGFAAYGVTEHGGGIAWGKIGQALLFTVAVMAPVYLILTFTDAVWLVDFRSWVVTLPPLTPARWMAFLGYLVPFAFFYVAQGILFNGFLRWRGGKAPLWQEMLVNSIVMTLGALVWVLIAYIPLLSGQPLPFGTDPQTMTAAGLGAIYYLPLLVFWPVAACLWTYFFRKTGRTYVGSIMVTVFIVWSLAASSSFQMWPING